jgi:hypothetical protein
MAGVRLDQYRIDDPVFLIRISVRGQNVDEARTLRIESRIIPVWEWIS